MDFGATLFGGRFAPPDTNAAVGPNHVVITTNSMVQVFDKSGVPADSGSSESATYLWESPMPLTMMATR